MMRGGDEFSAYLCAKKLVGVSFLFMRLAHLMRLFFFLLHATRAQSSHRDIVHVLDAHDKALTH